MRPFHQPRAPIAALAILLTSTPLALSGCGQDPDTAGLENNTIENVQVTLTPSIKASHPYRCEDNSVVTIDFISDDVTNNLSRSEEHTSELPSLMRNSYAFFCLKKKKQTMKDQVT